MTRCAVLHTQSEFGFMDSVQDCARQLDHTWNAPGRIPHSVQRPAAVPCTAHVAGSESRTRSTIFAMLEVPPGQNARRELASIACCPLVDSSIICDLFTPSSFDPPSYMLKSTDRVHVS